MIYEERVWDGARNIGLAYRGANGRDLHEFKSVLKVPDDIGTQFTKDLMHAESLINIKWIFDGKKLNLDAGNKALILDKIKTSLKSMKSDDLDGVASKLSATGKVSLRTADDVAAFIEANFSELFKAM